MGRWAVALLIASAGCGSVFGLEPLYECPSNDDDCDKLLDDVDPCPADPRDAADGDGDGDGVGDACDPNIQMPGDTIAAFDGFASQHAAWSVFGGTAQWRWRDSALAQDDLASGAIEWTISRIEQPTIQVLIDDVEFAGEGSTVGVYVLTTAGPGANAPLECRVVHYATHDDLVMILRTADDFPLYTAMAPALPGKPSDGLRIYGGQLPDGTVRCRARYGDADALYIDWKGPTPRAMMDKLGLRTINARAQFHAAVVYWVPL